MARLCCATGKESGNYSFDYADCGGTVPGYACTRDEAYCYVGWWCDYNYPAASELSTCMIKGLNFVQDEDQACGEHRVLSGMHYAKASRPCSHPPVRQE